MLIKIIEIGLEYGGAPPHGFDFFSTSVCTILVVAVMQNDIGVLPGEFAAHSSV